MRCGARPRERGGTAGGDDLRSASAAGAAARQGAAAADDARSEARGVRARRAAGRRHRAVHAELSRWEPELFVETVLVDWLRVAEVWVGANFLFGRDRSGTFTLLRALGEDRGFRDGEDRAGPLQGLRRLEHPHPAPGRRRPRRRGRGAARPSLLRRRPSCTATGAAASSGFPTANLETDNELFLPTASTRPSPARRRAAMPPVTSVGVRPTIGDGRVTVETHLLDVRRSTSTGNGSAWRSSNGFASERKFESWRRSAPQIARDCAKARALFEQIGVVTDRIAPVDDATPFTLHRAARRAFRALAGEVAGRYVELAGGSGDAGPAAGGRSCRRASIAVGANVASGRSRWSRVMTRRRRVASPSRPTASRRPSTASQSPRR